MSNNSIFEEDLPTAKSEESEKISELDEYKELILKLGYATSFDDD